MTDLEVFTPSEVITKTYELYDPGHSAILIGTAAIHWEIMKRGGDSSDIPLPDVDGLVSKEAMANVWTGQDSPYVSSFSNSEARLTLWPSPTAKALGATTLDLLRADDTIR